jgi:putative membrane protein
MVMTLLTHAQRQRVAEAISEVERETDAELVTVLARRADHYTYVPTLWAAAVALLTPGVLALTPLWLGLWDVLLAQWLVFVALALLLRWPPLMYRLIPKKLQHWRAGALARRQFLEQNLHHTHAETGLLIFVAEAEHYVEIIADRGIHRHVGSEQWQSIVDAFTARVSKGDTLQGFLECVRSCGALLKNHVPATVHKNELPNHMVVLDD